MYYHLSPFICAYELMMLCEHYLYTFGVSTMKRGEENGSISGGSLLQTANSGLFFNIYVCTYSTLLRTIGVDFVVICQLLDRLYGIVVRVLGYRSAGTGSIPGTTKKKLWVWNGVHPAL
jgi:hypothetical protein